MPKFRPIEREIYSDDIYAAFELAVHSRGGFRAAPQRRPASTFVNPAIAGVRVAPAVRGGYLNPWNNPQSTATGGRQNPPFGSGN